MKNNGNYFVIRNDSSLIAFKMTDKNENIGFNITKRHPAQEIKIYKDDVVQTGKGEAVVYDYGAGVDNVHDFATNW